MPPNIAPAKPKNQIVSGSAFSLEIVKVQSCKQCATHRTEKSFTADQVVQTVEENATPTKIRESEDKRGSEQSKGTEEKTQASFDERPIRGGGQNWSDPKSRSAPEEAKFSKEIDDRPIMLKRKCEDPLLSLQAKEEEWRKPEKKVEPKTFLKRKTKRVEPQKVNWAKVQSKTKCWTSNAGRTQPKIRVVAIHKVDDTHIQ